LKQRRKHSVPYQICNLKSEPPNFLMDDSSAKIHEICQSCRSNTQITLGRNFERLVCFHLFTVSMNRSLIHTGSLGGRAGAGLSSILATTSQGPGSASQVSNPTSNSITVVTRRNWSARLPSPISAVSDPIHSAFSHLPQPPPGLSKKYLFDQSLLGILEPLQNDP